MDIEIRRAVAGDAAEILALQKLCYRSEAALTDDFEIPPLTQDLASLERDFAAQLFLKAVDGGRLIGSVRAYQRDGTCHVGRLIVHPEVQNRGIGTRLMHEIEALFPHATRLELFTGEKSERNITLYRKLGYRAFKTERLSPRTMMLFMEKRRGQ
jgi:ribosomal protein S18 acetylase RimI-like enzyme